ncbi:uracil-DNA glycosylase family protein [Lacunimicrobium album]
MSVVAVSDFASWRDEARALLAANQPPHEITFIDATTPQKQSLFVGSAVRIVNAPTTPRSTPRVPKDFLTLAEKVSCHRDEIRFELLYRVLWRLTHGEPNLLEIETDDDVRRLYLMEKAVRRDAHKMKAFVRFRRVEQEGEEYFIAWHRPDHHTVKPTAPFFTRRFPSMRWSILTPDLCAHWDLEELTFTPGVTADQAPQGDLLEDMWKTYYRAIFNPARIKLKAMVKEMPKRHWKTLPETRIIDDLLDEAPGRVEEMVRRQTGLATSAADFIPADHDYESLRQAAMSCRGCPLYQDATQTIFGEGPINAKLMLVGEQPGDKEDLEGKPFVGPAGQILDQALTQAGIDRSQIYVTNTVKHFKFTKSSKIRQHSKPNVHEMTACKPWVQAEIALVKPEVMVCLGATAAQTLIGRDFKITKQRGEFIASDYCDQTIATYHPSAILRMPTQEARDETMAALIQDLRKVASVL